MRGKYHIICNSCLSFLAILCIQMQVNAQAQTQIQAQMQSQTQTQLETHAGTQAKTQRNYAVAPNDIALPWYSQKIAGYPYAHCSLASSLMVFDYFKGMNSESQRSSKEAEEKLIEYQRNYFLKKRAPFRRRTSVGQGGYYSFEIDSLARYYENMVSAEHFQQKNYGLLKNYIDRGIPVLVNVRYTGATRGLRPGPRGHWMVLRGIDDRHVWVNDPGRSPEMRNKAENICYPIKKQIGNPSYFDGCWTGRFIIVTPKEWIRSSLYAQVGKLPPLEEVIQIIPPTVSGVTHSAISIKLSPEISRFGIQPSSKN